MNRQEIYEFLRQRGIWHEITEHRAVFSMEELSAVELPYPGADAKNLFIRDDRKLNYCLLTVAGAGRVDLKEFRRTHRYRPLSFVSAQGLMEVMGLVPGSVSPFGLFNDRDLRVKFFIDEAFFSGRGIIGVHPNDNTATVWLKAQDLVSIVREHGNQVEVFAP